MDRKQSILDSAEALARGRGFDAFSYADIEADVGIRKASIHHHYASKSALALALIQRYSTRFFAGLAAVDAKSGTAGARLSAYLAIYRRALSGGRSLCPCVAFSAGRDSLSAPVLDELNGFHDRSIDWLEGVFAQAKKDRSIKLAAEPRSEAVAALALVEGAQLIARAAQDATRFDAAVAGLRTRLRG